MILSKLPEVCDECPLHYDWEFETEDDGYNYKTICVLEREYENCPLKPLPEKEKHSNYDDDVWEAYKNGWNDCLDEIEGKEDDYEN